MKVIVEVDCSNAAFVDYPGELQRIHREARKKAKKAMNTLRKDKTFAAIKDKLLDTNGNVVGFVKVVSREEG